MLSLKYTFLSMLSLGYNSRRKDGKHVCGHTLLKVIKQMFQKANRSFWVCPAQGYRDGGPAHFGEWSVQYYNGPRLV